MKPALTQDEWRLVRLWRAGKMPGGKVRGAIDELWSAEIRHAVAAQCLYAQPFGFTQADVRHLVDLAETCEAESGDDWKDDGPKLRDLAARIAALLPPEDA